MPHTIEPLPVTAVEIQVEIYRQTGETVYMTVHRRERPLDEIASPMSIASQPTLSGEPVTPAGQAVRPSSALAPSMSVGEPSMSAGDGSSNDGSLMRSAPQAAPEVAEESYPPYLEESGGDDGIVDSEAGGVWGDDSTAAVIGSVLAHLIVVLALALLPVRIGIDEEAIVLVSGPPELAQEVKLIDEVSYSDIPKSEIGNQGDARSEMAAASAEMFAAVSEIPNPIDVEPTDVGQILFNQAFAQAVAPLDRLDDAKGNVGQGTQGVTGAVDRITFEILRAVEERPTLVVWLFDQSGSLHRQRQQIRDRFERIYEELGVATEGKLGSLGRNKNEIPILTSIIGFGSGVTLYTEDPTDDLEEIKSIVDSIEVDTTGIERPFTAVESAVKQYQSLRRIRGPNGPQRNVLFIVVTDERGDDTEKLESSITACRKWGIPVYVVGVPAPFGREYGLVKYVDPDPKFDQTPRWAQVDQGPETFLPERVKIGFTGKFEDEPVIDSGFGSFALTRLCYETGGIFFTVHPNRNVSRRVTRRETEAFASQIDYFFDSAVMARYRPDYVPPSDYVAMVKASPLRQSLVAAAQMNPASGLSRPQMRFVKRSDAQLVGDLTRAQQDAAKLTPRLDQLLLTLEPGMAARDSEDSPRWRAGYDLAMGRVLAQKVRTETYNLMLAQVKRGQAFEDAKNNTWILESSDEVSVGSKWQREAETATSLLQGVIAEHTGTPWALLAKKELEIPMGWTWKESFTDLAPPAANRPGNNNNNNNPRPPQDDQKRMLEKRPLRPVPKL